jgi:hypothetical protein
MTELAQNTGGRFSLLLTSPEVRAGLIEAVEAGEPVGTALRKIGVTADLFYNDWRTVALTGRWRNGTTPSAEHLAIICEFVTAIDQARAAYEAKLIAILNEAAGKANEKTGQLDWRPASWILQNHPAYRRDWHPEPPPQPNRVAVVVDRPSLREVSDADLIELAGDEWKAILGEGNGEHPA